MAILTPNALLGRNITSLTITAQDVASDGTLSNNTSGAKNITAVVTSKRMQYQNELEEISGVTQRRKNFVIIETGTTMTVTGFVLANDSATLASSTNLCNALFQAFDYFKTIFTRGGLVETFYCVANSYEFNMTGKGKIEFTMELAMVDPNTANPVQT